MNTDSPHRGWKIWFWVVILALGTAGAAGAADFTTPYTSDTTWEVPATVTEITIKAWGGGGGGGGGGKAKPAVTAAAAVMPRIFPSA